MVFALVFWLMTHPEASHHHGEQVDVGSRLKRVTKSPTIQPPATDERCRRPETYRRVPRSTRRTRNQNCVETV